MLVGVFDEPADSQPECDVPRVDDAPLHVCVGCASTLVQLVAYEDVGDAQWFVVLRCPECLLTRSGMASDEACAALDDVLEAGMDELFAMVLQLRHDNMAADVEAIAAALYEDRLRPEDF